MKRRLTICSALCILVAMSVTQACAGPGRTDDILFPEDEVRTVGYDYQAFDALFPSEFIWENGFQIEGQIGTWLVEQAALGFGLGIGSLTPNRKFLLQEVQPHLPLTRVDPGTVHVRGSCVTFTIGPTVLVQFAPTDWLAVSVQGGLRYTFFPVSPSVQGEEEHEFGGDEITIPGSGEDDEIEIERINYATEYEEEIDFSGGMFGRVALQLEVGRPGEMTGVIGVGRIYDFTESVATYRGEEIGEFGLHGLMARIAFRNSW